MAENKLLETFGDLFDENNNSEENNQNVVELKVETLVAFENHPFKLYVGDRLDDMVESIKNQGVIVPIIVRQKKLKYEILSGHNRVNAAKIAEFKTVPAIIKEDLTDEEAILIVTETNLIQRSFADMIHSERAAVIATRHSALKNQGVRTELLESIKKASESLNLANDNDFSPVGKKARTHNVLTNEYKISKNSIARYLRINKLNPKLKDLVDTEQIAIRAGVDLSYLSDESQKLVEGIVSENNLKIDMKKASALRECDKNGKLTWNTATDIFVGEDTKKDKKPAPFKIKYEVIKKYFKEDETKKDIEKIIDKALETYFENH